jgi:hypothetical protein
MNTNITQTLNEMGLTMTADFVPFSQSRNAKKNPKIEDLSINWLITIKRGNRSLTVDYMQGIGHLPKEIRPPVYYRKMSIDQSDLIFYACETGKVGFYVDASQRSKKLNPPELSDVLGCLILDAEVLDYGSFESWADEFGYNSDSIEDRKVYDDCMKIALQFRQLFTDTEITRLHELYQDW